MKEALCKAFCSSLHVDHVPAGWAVQTPYRLPDGDPVVFFVVTLNDGMARLEDDGATLALLEASGVSLDKKGSRWRTFSDLLEQHQASYDEDAGVIVSPVLAMDEVPAAAINFTALMLRVHDLALLTVERVRESWRDDALADLHANFDGVAEVQESAIVSARGALTADVVIRPKGAPPVAVILATSQAKGLHALVLKMELEKYQGDTTPVILLVERAKDNPLAESTYALAQSRLNGVHTYRGAEPEAMAAIRRYIPAETTLQ